MRFGIIAGALALILAAAGFTSAQAPAEKKADRPRPASIHVTLPANATLTLNGDKTSETGENRWYVTPPLDPGKNYSATIKIHFVRDGNDFSIERKVTLRAGKIKHVNFLPKEHFAHLHEDAPRPTVIVAPVQVGETDIPQDWPTDWTGN